MELNMIPGFGLMTKYNVSSLTKIMKSDKGINFEKKSKLRKYKMISYYFKKADFTGNFV